MTIIFDGQTRVYTQCRICQQTMLVVNMLDLCHPCCDPELELTEEHVNDNLCAAAVLYAGWGFPVFPLGTRSKKPAIPKAEGGHGFLDAITNPERVGRWWLAHPRHNIGIATGHRFDVIDIDPDKGGSESLTKLLAAQRIPNVHGLARTASGGLHLYVKPTSRGNYAGIEPGVDYRGLGGYCAAPPSTRSPGHSYTWLVTPSPIIKAGNDKTNQAGMGTDENRQPGRTHNTQSVA